MVKALVVLSQDNKGQYVRELFRTSPLGFGLGVAAIAYGLLKPSKEEKPKTEHGLQLYIIENPSEELRNMATKLLF